MLPATHADRASQANVVAFQPKPRLQAQLAWPTSELLVLYSSVVGHERQAASPSTENWPAAHALHTTLAFATQTEEPS